MNCKDCPYVEIEPIDFDEEDIWCEKVGGKVRLYGSCTDALDISGPSEHSSKKRKRNKRERDLKYKNHLRYLERNCRYYPAPVTYVDETWIKGVGYVQSNNPYYKRLYLSNRIPRYYKKLSNRKVRRYQGEFCKKGNGYRKVYDYWWEIC